MAAVGFQPVEDDKNRRVTVPASRILLVAPLPPPYGGMALQAGLLQRLLQEDGLTVELLGHNQSFHSRLKFLERVPTVRTVIRALVFYSRFWSKVQAKEVVHILAASWVNFLLVVCPAVLIGRICGKRVVLNYRAGDADTFLRYCAWLVKPFFRMASVVTTPSGFLAEVIEKRIGVPVSIVSNIVNLSRFQYRDRVPFQPKLLVTRHLEKIYDVETSIRAFREIQAAFPTATLWIAGTGSEQRNLTGLVSRWRLQGVHFLGYRSHEELAQIYGQCDILLNASRVDNFPGSLVEASAAGLVIVSTKAGGIPFLYTSEKDALLVDIGDWRRMAYEVKRVLQEQELAQHLVTGGRELAGRCDWPAVRTILYNAYGFDPEYY